MKITIYQLISNPEKRFSINEEFEYKYHNNGTSTKTQNKKYLVLLMQTKMIYQGYKNL